MLDACFVLSVGQNMYTLLFSGCLPACHFRLLAVLNSLERNVPLGASVTAKHMLASCSIYHYD